MDCFCITHTLINNVHPKKRRTVRTEEVVAAFFSQFDVHSNWSCIEPPYGRSWFTSLQGTARARAEAV